MQVGIEFSGNRGYMEDGKKGVRSHRVSVYSIQVLHLNFFLLLRSSFKFCSSQSIFLLVSISHNVKAFGRRSARP